MRTTLRVGRRRTSRAGLTLVEVCLTMGIVATVLLTAAGAFQSSLRAVESSNHRTSGAVFLETVMQNLSGQDFGGLLALNGNQFFDQTNAADSQYTVNLSTFLVDPDLMQIEATLFDVRTNRELGRVVSMRSER